MDAIESIGLNARITSPVNRFSELTSEEFVRIITTELSHQDPLEPNDTTALIEQFSNLRSIQADIDTGARLESLVQQNELASAAALIGQRVSGLDESASRVQGVVRSVSRSSLGPTLTLDTGARIRFADLDLIEQMEVTP